jgi:energy-coupling factor transport system permease protein
MRLDPRTKLVLALAGAVVLMVTTHLATLAVEMAMLAILVFALKLGRVWLGTLRVLLPMSLFLVVMSLWAFDIPTALAGALRLIAMSTVFMVFFQTTAPEDLATSLVSMGVPYAFAFILATAMQFIPVLSRKMQDIMDAQRARGIRLERDLASVGNYAALFTPLLIQSFTLADQLAEAMEARGFSRPHRTWYTPYGLRRLDFVVMVLGLLLSALALQFR